jgi:hypothetical protein
LALLREIARRPDGHFALAVRQLAALTVAVDTALEPPTWHRRLPRLRRFALRHKQAVLPEITMEPVAVEPATGSNL